MIRLYEIDDEYVEYLRKFDKKVLSPKTEDRKQTRKYIGVILNTQSFNYFIPLSSYKPETYDSMYESISLKKIEDMAVLRVNNMIPVVDNVVHEIKFSLVTDEQYRTLLQNEYRIIKAREREIRTDARIVYFYRLNIKNKNKGLYKICCDFKLLENAAQKWVDGDSGNGGKILVGSTNST